MKEHTQISLDNDEVTIPITKENVVIGGSGTSDFNQLTNRPKYAGQTMTGETDIPEVPTNTSDLNNDSDYQTGSEVESAISEAVSGKQDILTAGDNITIESNVISATGGGSVTPVQTTGTSTTDVMSQNATTSMIFADPDRETRIRIGGSSSNLVANYSVAIGAGSATQSGKEHATAVGYASRAMEDKTTSLGSHTSAFGSFSVAVGSGAKATAQGQFDISTGSYSTRGYNNTNYRLLTGVHDGQTANDAVTIGQVNATIDAINAALNTSIPHIGA